MSFSYTFVAKSGTSAQAELTKRLTADKQPTVVETALNAIVGGVTLPADTLLNVNTNGHFNDDGTGNAKIELTKIGPAV